MSNLEKLGLLIVVILVAVVGIVAMTPHKTGQSIAPQSKQLGGDTSTRKRELTAEELKELLAKIESLQKQLAEKHPDVDRPNIRLIDTDPAQLGENVPSIKSRGENVTTLEGAPNEFDARFPELAQRLTDAGIQASRSFKSETVSISFSRQLSPTEKLVWYIGGTATDAQLDYYLERPSRNQEFGNRVTFTDDPDDMPRRDTVVSSRSGTLEKCVEMLIAEVKATRREK